MILSRLNVINVYILFIWVYCNFFHFFTLWKSQTFALLDTMSSSINNVSNNEFHLSFCSYKNAYSCKVFISLQNSHWRRQSFAWTPFKDAFQKLNKNSFILSISTNIKIKYFYCYSSQCLFDWFNNQRRISSYLAGLRNQAWTSRLLWSRE